MLFKKSENNNLLDAKILEEGKQYNNIICYVVGNRAGVTVYNKGYYTFFVKDINGNVLPAQIWDPANFIASGIEVSKMKHVCVLLSFTAQIYNGSWSLVVNGSAIEVCTPETMAELGVSFDIAIFRGRVEPGDTSELDTAFQKYTGLPLPAMFTTLSLPTICQGRVGGYAKIVSAAYKSLKETYGNLKEIDFDLLAETYVVTIQAYAVYLKAVDSGEMTTAHRVADVIVSIRQGYRTEVVEQAIDTTLALIGSAAPEHLFAHLIVGELKSKIQAFDLIYRNTTIPKHMSAQIGGLKLTNY